MIKRDNVINMESVRELVAQLDALRRDVLAGNVLGWGGTVKFADDREVVYVGGTFHTDTRARTRAMLLVSAQRMLAEDDPPKMKTVRSR